MQILQVGDLTTYLKMLLESQEDLADVWVAGEVSNATRAPSGHVYFTLKDARSQIGCVMWRDKADRLLQPVKNGVRVLARGYVTIYEARGVYQLYVNELQAEGVGLLAAQFEELKARLDAEGLFAAEHKRALPALPRRIGVVTSLSGAVLHDIIMILRRRYPLGEVVVAPSAVQGPEAPSQICAALAALQRLGDIDVVIVARGGGSLEDLWAFNDEAVARAIYGSSVPVISAVGHEVDFTIADFVADVRAPTPSAAAEIVATSGDVLAARVDQAAQRLLDLLRAALDVRRARLAAEERALTQLSPRLMLDQRRQRVDDLWQRIATSAGHDLALRRSHLAMLGSQLVALDPAAVIGRGFAIVWKARKSAVVSRVGQVEPGERLQVQVSDGLFDVVADGDARPKRAAKAPAGGQMSLNL